MRKGPVFLSVTSSANLQALDATNRKLREVSKTAKTSSGGFKSFGKALGAIGGAAAVVGLATKALTEAQEAFKVSAMTVKILQNTGLAASISSKQIDDLAMTISNLTGIEDEQIQSASNVLLGIQGLVPAGKDAYNSIANLTQVATDLGVRIGKDPVAGAKLLAKALNYPQKAILSLYRAGVPLSQQTAERLKQLVEANRLEEARALVLKDLTTQTKGVAAAVTDPLSKLRVIFNNLLETFGTPILDSLTPVVAALQPLMQALSPVIAEVGAGFAVIIKQFADALIPYLPMVADLIRALVPILVDVLKVFLPLLPLIVGLIPTVTLLARVLNYILKPVLFAVQIAFVAVVGVITGLLKVLAAGLGWIPGLGKALHSAADAAGDAASQLMKVSLASTDSQMSQGLADQAVNYKDAAAALNAGAKNASSAAKAVGAATGKKTAKVKPKTATSSRSRVGDQSFTVAGSGGGLSLSVTVNGSVVQERDIARTIRDELLQFARRQGVQPNFGV